MKIKYIPSQNNQLDSVITIIDDNSIEVDGELFEFDLKDVFWEPAEIADATNWKIIRAYREEGGELYLDVLKHYKTTKEPWDTGEYV